MPQRVFDGLGGGIGRAGKGPERGHIDEMALIPASNIQTARRGAEYPGGGLYGVRRNMEACGEIVRTALREIAQQGQIRLIQFHQRGNRLIQRSVPAGYHDHIVFHPVARNICFRIAGSGCVMN